MYKLKIIAGPNRGASYRMRDGENAIGRQSGNAVVLQSSRVSKRHCVLIVDNTRVELRDEGSANGTFINGVLSKEKNLKPGDRISVGEFVLELRSSSGREGQGGARAGADAVAAGSLFPAPPLAVGNGNPGGLAFPAAGTAPGSGMPRDLKGRAFWAFENYVMPIFYGLITKYEWNTIVAAIFCVFTVVNVMISVGPLLESNRGSIVSESKRRARFMARQIAEMNAPYLATRAETKTDVGIAPTAEGVRLAVLTDLENRVIAPVAKAGQYLVGGPEARLAKHAVELFSKGREVGVAEEFTDSTVVAVEPVKVFSPALARNVIVAMAVVSIDISVSTMSAGEMGEVYSKSMIFSGLLCALVVFIVYRLTLRPFHQLSEDMDKVLKGDMSQVTREYKVEEMNGLWDMIHVALQRLPKDSGGAKSGESGGPTAEDFIGPMKALGTAGNIGVALFGPDRRFVFVNDLFEEMSGIRAGDALGQEISAVARDQSIGQVFNDLFERTAAATEGAAEEAELSPGISFRIQMAAFGKSGEPARCYVVTAVKSG